MWTGGADGIPCLGSMRARTCGCRKWQEKWISARARADHDEGVVVPTKLKVEESTGREGLLVVGFVRESVDADGPPAPSLVKSQ